MKKLLVFVAGISVGVLATWTYQKNKYEKRTKEDTESVKESFRRNCSSAEDTEQTAVPVTEEDVANYHELVHKYVAAFEKTTINAPEKEKEGENVESKCPYVIPPQDVGDEYDIITLTYYADHVLAYDDGDVLSAEEIEATVGLASLTRFGEYETDSVFVRNTNLQHDYEILLEYRDYTDRD